MRIPIIVPDVGSGEEPLQLCGWLVDEGDMVLAGDLVAELLIPGITVEIMSEASGRLDAIMKPIDAAVHVGDVLAWIEDAPATPDEPA